MNKQETSPRAIIVITLDALRADHVGCYGYPLPTTPFLDNLASKSISLDHVFSPAPLTTPSHTSLLTSKYPRFHSVGFSNGDKTLSKEHEVTLPTVLQEFGYTTAAFVSIAPLHRRTGLDLGFDYYDDDLTEAEVNRGLELRRSADGTTSAVLNWIGKHQSKPFFTWVHYAEPHGPYTPPAPYNSIFVGNKHYGESRMLDVVPNYEWGGVPTYQVLRAERDDRGELLNYERDHTYYLSQYDGYIRYLDDRLEGLVNTLREWDLYDDSLLIITADHGEAMGENDVFFFHSLTVSLEQIRVPLLIKTPSQFKLKPTKLAGPASTLDIMPTILRFCGYETQYLGFQGLDLLRTLTNMGIPWPRRSIFSEIPTQLSVVDNRFQLLYTKEKSDVPSYPRAPAVAGVKLFDYIADPVGKCDLSATHPDITRRLKTTAERYLRVSQPNYTPTSNELSDEEKEIVKERLRQLGYLTNDSAGKSKRDETEASSTSSPKKVDYVPAVRRAERYTIIQRTGEKLAPWIEDTQLHYEYLNRYAFATHFVVDKKVLDLACGEGYGTYMLAREASYVAGVEIDETAVQHARSSYTKHNLDFIEGSILAVPIEGEKMFDVVVCFETIEYTAEHDKLLSEVKRLLKDDGLFIVSTSNKTIRADAPRRPSSVHTKELCLDELKGILGRHFAHVHMFGQRVYAGSNMWSIDAHKSGGYIEAVVKKRDKEFYFVERTSKEPSYFIALASDASLTPATSVTDSWLTDISNAFFKDYERRLAELNQTRLSQINSLETSLQQIQHSIPMQLMYRYQRIVDKLMRPGTPCRRPYELMLSSIRVILNEGWRGFFREVRAYLLSKRDRASKQQ